MSERWCPVCNTQHGAQESCPGTLTVSEPERHGWRVLVHTGSRTEVYGVLVAPAGGPWRARIVTFPRMLWSIPGERGSLKFAGDTAAAVEAKAADFIRAYCARRGYTILGEPAIVESSGAADPGTATSPGIAARRRFLKNLPVRFGRETLDREGLTADLSHGGLFVATERPLPTDSPIKLRLHLDGYSVPLSGRVAWSRAQREEGRPPGMGVQLIHAPPMYRRYVDELMESAAADSTDGHETEK